jgi:hypothetical protein
MRPPLRSRSKKAPTSPLRATNPHGRRPWGRSHRTRGFPCSALIALEPALDDISQRLQRVDGTTMSRPNVCQKQVRMGRDQAGEVEEHIPALHEGHEEHDPWQEFYGEGGDEKVDASRGRLEGGPVVGQRQDQGRTEGHPTHDEGVEDQNYRADEEEEHDEIAFARETHALAVGGVFEDYARLAVVWEG